MCFLLHFELFLELQGESKKVAPSSFKNFIQLSITLAKLCYIKHNHLVSFTFHNTSSVNFVV